MYNMELEEKEPQGTWKFQALDPSEGFDIRNQYSVIGLKRVMAKEKCEVERPNVGVDWTMYAPPHDLTVDPDECPIGINGMMVKVLLMDLEEEDDNDNDDELAEIVQDTMHYSRIEGDKFVKEPVKWISSSKPQSHKTLRAHGLEKKGFPKIEAPWLPDATMD